MLPEWLAKTEDVRIRSDKDAFFDQTILAMLRLLARIRTQNESHADRFGVSALLKLILTIVLVTLIAVSANVAFVAVSIVYLLVILSLMRGDEIIRILGASLAMSLFSFILLLPAALAGNTRIAVVLTLKVFATLIAVHLMTQTTRWRSLTIALKSLHTPDLFIFVLDIAIKYILLLGDFSLNMFYALKLRSVGRNSNKYSSLSGIAGTMFIKSKEMAEEMHAAMECRGFTGSYPTHHRWQFSWADGIYLFINAGIVAIFVLLL